MLDLIQLNNPEYFELVKKSLVKRNNSSIDLNEIKTLVLHKKKLTNEVDLVRAQRNQLTQSYQDSKANNNENIASIEKQLMDLKEQLIVLEKEEEKIQEQLNQLAFDVPNLLEEDVPAGFSEEDNQQVFVWGKLPEKNFEMQSHDAIGEKLDILDIQRGVKLAKSRFFVLKKEGAALERALVSFFIDEAVKNGFEELFTPFMVNDKALFGTGQLPKFQEDLFKIENENLYLIPTAEVPITNFFAREIIAQETLPKYFVGYSSCFRKEAGSYGKDTKGIFRVHQFQKVELVKLILPDQGEQELQSLLDHVKMLLEKLELPYRIVLLCGGDTGFSSAKTYDFEVYIPSEKRYREVSSCSYFRDFQSRRGELKYKDKITGKNVFYHTINGSGLAIERIFIAILEHYQNQDGEVLIPQVLRPYMKNLQKITWTKKDTL